MQLVRAATHTDVGPDVTQGLNIDECRILDPLVRVMNLRPMLRQGPPQCGQGQRLVQMATHMLTADAAIGRKKWFLRKRQGGWNLVCLATAERVLRLLRLLELVVQIILHDLLSLRKEHVEQRRRNLESFLAADDLRIALGHMGEPQ